jgi:ABC-type multidrug transport system ATPase subunit
MRIFSHKLPPLYCLVQQFKNTSVNPSFTTGSTQNNSTKNDSDNNVSSSGVTIETQALGKRFNREWVFRNLSFDFSGGSVYALTGPNGSGKSTLLQVLWGQVPPTAGTIQYTKTNTTIPVEDICHHISIAAPYMDLIDEFTLIEQLNFHFRLKKIRKGNSIQDLIDIMYLNVARDKYIGNFSSGMKQRLKLGLAIYTEADFIFLDEPGTNLDEQAFNWYKNQLSRLPSGCVLIIASNDSREYPQTSKIINLTQIKSETGA